MIIKKIWQEFTNIIGYSGVKSLKDKFFKPLIAIATFLLLIGLIIVLTVTPNDALQGWSSKIMYVHVPSAWICLMFYLASVFANIIYLSYKNIFFAIVSYAIALPGLFFNIICILTGMIWGRLTWGVWWAWDVRLTSVLILAIFYTIYIITYLNAQKSDGGQSGYRIAAAISIIGAINLPIIKFSVMMYNSIHQTASVLRAGGPSIHISMLYQLFIIFIACLCGSSAYIIYKLHKMLLDRKKAHELIKNYE